MTRYACAAQTQTTRYSRYSRYKMVFRLFFGPPPATLDKPVLCHSRKPR